MGRNAWECWETHNCKMKCPYPIENYCNGDVLYDKLVKNRARKAVCDGEKCLGSLMNQKPQNKPFTPEEVKEKAADFMKQYYTENKLDIPMETRMEEITKQIDEHGTYELNVEELQFGAQTAWRNAARCPARVIWRNLNLIDKRTIDTADEMFEAIKSHMKISFNGGKIKPSITVFKGRKPGFAEPRVWNGLMVSYAGYEDGTFIGDPGNLDFTRFCESLGWKGKGGMFDFLPIVLSGPDGVPHWYEVPEELVKRVPIKHPTSEAINSLNLEWFGLPFVAGMMLEVGGVQFPASPFSGWYTGAEIATRDFLDTQRYNLLETIGGKMGLDTNNNSNLWKDKVSLELNIAVLQSYQQAGVSIVDHYTQSDQFLDHMKAEYETRGGCPADWVWIVPPQGGSLVSSYHQEMVNYHLSPAYEYQDKLWMNYGRKHVKKSLRAVSWMLLFWNSIYKKLLSKRQKVSVFYATETGTSKKFATSASQLFGTTFDSKVYPINTPNVFSIIKESKIALFVTSTFGNGEPPTMATGFDNKLGQLMETMKGESCDLSKTSLTEDFVSEVWIKNLHFGVFALGSSAYPNFAAFGKHLDSSLFQLGGERLVAVGTGDELGNQEGAFKVWAKQTFLTACEDLNIQTTNLKMAEAINMMSKAPQTDPAFYRRRVMERRTELNDALGKTHNADVKTMKITRREKLHNEEKESPTILVSLSPSDLKPVYEPGDHMGVCPRNGEDDINCMLEHFKNPPPKNQPLALEAKSDLKAPWLPVDTYPKGLTFLDLLHYFVDIRPVPSQALLKILSENAQDNKEKVKLHKLGTKFDAYSSWKQEHDAGIVETLKMFPSVKVCSATIISNLPTIKPRRYSIASTREWEGSDVGLVVGVVDYTHKSGKRRFGLATGNLNNSCIGSVLPGFLRSEKNFRLPEDPKKDVMLITAGSGISPFRGFWMKRGEQLQAGKEPGKTIIYFGCRNKNMNLLKEETDRLAQSGLKIERHVAYSQEPDIKKEYVQDKVWDDYMMVYKMIKDEGAIYVCGKVKMAQAVQDVLKKILEKFLRIDGEDAHKMIMKMKT